MNKRLALTAGLLLVPLGCGTLSAQPETPAVIVEPTPAGRAELARLAGEAANGGPVLLADDALTRDSVLVVERREPPGPDGRVLTGRMLERPVRLQLVLRGRTCMLVREADGRRWPLTASRCAPR